MKSYSIKSIFTALMLLLVVMTACSINSTPESTQIGVVEQPGTLQPPALSQSGGIVAGDVGRILDDFISQDNPLFSGSILVAQEGEILLSKGYNYANWELKTANSSQTKFRISSITKPFTATLIMMMVENGTLSLDDRLCDHLPDCPTAWQGIEIQNLLNHTSGIVEYTSLDGAAQTSRLPHSTAGLIDLFRNESLEFAPGETYRYSNSNYILLGAVLEQVSRTSFDLLLRRIILDPLRMRNSGMDDNTRILDNRASGYQIQGRDLINAPYLDMSNAYATAGMYSTILDLFAFDQALVSGLLLSEDSLESMYTPQYAADGSGGNYGLGWQLGESNGYQRIGHAGVINGFHVSMTSYPDQDFTIIVLSNFETEDVAQIVSGLEGILFEKGSTDL